MQVDTVVLDVDGVLVDVSNSYRRAIVRSVAVVYGETVRRADVQVFKDAGGFNNDWVLTDAVALFVLAQAAEMPLDVEAFGAAIRKLGGGLDGAKQVIESHLGDRAEEVFEAWDPDRLREVFQQLYLGPAGYRSLEGGMADLYTEREIEDLPPSGYMADEPVLIAEETVESLQRVYALGVVTGRPRAEAELALERVGLSIPPDQLLAMEDHAGKPDPEGLLSVASATGATALAFAGDTLDDVLTAHNASEADEGRRYFGIGVLTGGLTGDRGRAAFEDSGAAAVIETVNELPEKLEPR